MAEWFKALVSKTSMGAISSWVRIPLSPGSLFTYLHGEVLEWPNRRDWKSRVSCKRNRGFESHPLRHQRTSVEWDLPNVDNGDLVDINMSLFLFSL